MPKQQIEWAVRNVDVYITQILSALLSGIFLFENNGHCVFVAPLPGLEVFLRDDAVNACMFCLYTQERERGKDTRCIRLTPRVF